MGKYRYDVYPPSEDTFLLLDALRSEKRVKGKVVVEIGCGNGVIGEFLAEVSSLYVGIDINKNACLLCSQKINKGFVVVGDGLESINCEKIEVFVFNPPYLPAMDMEELDPNTEGGKTGIETTLKFIEQIMKGLAGKDKIERKVYFVSSSLSPLNIMEKNIWEIMDKYRIKGEIKKIKKMRWEGEELVVYKITITPYSFSPSSS